MRILVVEDEDAIADPLVAGLAREGFEVERVATGQAALEAAEPDVVAREGSYDHLQEALRLGVEHLFDSQPEQARDAERERQARVVLPALERVDGLP